MNINEYYDEIRRDIAKEYGLEAAGYINKPEYALSVKQCLELKSKYGFEKALEIAKRYNTLKKVGTN